jgi:hypothetical protein
MLLVLGAAQFIPVDRTNPPVKSEVSAPPPVEAMLRRACYDCHSNQTRWPWYSRVAPVSWFVAHHVHEGRKDLNFSEWPLFDLDGQDLALEGIRKQLENRRMPLESYLLLHPEARLTDAEIDTLLRWAGANPVSID